MVASRAKPRRALTGKGVHIVTPADRGSVPGARVRCDRELEVLGLVAKGLNNRDAARELFISENTVKNHVRNILEKLQLHSRMEAVMYAVREKLLDIP
jgi:DNA-binding NarL/FixJ family response regulator